MYIWNVVAKLKDHLLTRFIKTSKNCVLDKYKFLSVRYLYGWNSSPLEELGFKRGLNTSFNTNIC